MMYFLMLIPALFLVLSVVFSIRSVRKGQNTRKAVARQMLSFAFVCLLCFVIPMAVNAAPADGATAPTADTAAAAPVDTSRGLGLMAAAVVTGLSGIGGGIAVAASAPAAIGATSEDPKAFGKALIFVVLGEGIALYGLLVSILILAKV